MAGQQKNSGWLCHWCRVMNGKHANCCHRCGGKWYDVGEDSTDHTYTHWQRTQRKQPQPETEQWPAAPSHGRGRGQVPNVRPQQRSRRGRKPSASRGDQSQPATQPPGPPALPNAQSDVSWMTLLQMQQTANQNSAQVGPEADPGASSTQPLPADMKKLLASLKKDQDKLSPENQELVKSLSAKDAVKEQRDEEKELQQAVKSLSRARRDLAEAVEARSNLHAKWRLFLSLSATQWQNFTQEFQDQETSAQQKINEAKDAVALAKTTFEASRETVVFKEEKKEVEVQEIATDDEAMDGPSAGHLQEGLQALTNSLKDLHRQAETAHAEEQASKKARLGDHGKAPDATDVCEHLGQSLDHHLQSPLILNWTHRILKEPTFCTEWQARADAVRLSFECGTLRELTPAQPILCDDGKLSKHLKVTFDESVTLFCCDEQSRICSSFWGPHGNIQSNIRIFQRKLHLDDDPLSPQAVSISQVEDFKLSDQHEPVRLAPSSPSADPQQLPPGQVPRLPAFVDDVLNSPQVLHRGPHALRNHPLRIRTWYIHHEHFPRWRAPRFVELTHELHRWPAELISAWRDMILPDLIVHFHAVFPDPPRHYVTPNADADVIISQGALDDRAVSLLTVSANPRIGLQGPFALALSLSGRVSGRHIIDAADLSQLCQLERCAIYFEWDEIALDPPELHRLRAGQGFTLYWQGPIPAASSQMEVDPLSSSAVSISHPGLPDDPEDTTSFVQRPFPKKTSTPVTCNEGDIPDWYPLTDRGAPGQDNDSPATSTDQASSVTDPPLSPEPDGPDDGDGGEDYSPTDDPNRQSALMYHLNDNPVHAMLYWTDYERLMREICWHFEIPRQDLFDSYELTVRPRDIPDGTAPLIVHFVNDFPHGNQMALILLDVEIHANVMETHFHTHPEIRRRVLVVPETLTRSTLLSISNTFEYCRLEHDRCLVEWNHQSWPRQQTWPIEAAHGDYARIILPPPKRCDVATDAMLLDSQEMTVEDFWGQYYEPTSSESAPSSPGIVSDVSPSLADSAEIKREFGPRTNVTDLDPEEHSQLQLDLEFLEADELLFLMQHEVHAASSNQATNDAPHTDLAAGVDQVVQQSCLLSFDPASPQPWPMWYRCLRTAFGDTAVVEHDDEGPVAYFDTWYADCRHESITEVSRSVRLDGFTNLWLQDIHQVWIDKIQPGSSVFIVWVRPMPPPTPLSRSSGHLILYQFPEVNQIPFLLTFQFTALTVEGFSHAVVVTSPTASPLHIVQMSNMERVCHGRRCTLRRGTPGATWDEAIHIGENLRLVVPPPGARSHDDILSSPRAVAIVQTAPAVNPFLGLSMHLDDQSAFVQRLHPLWQQHARQGPAQIERLLPITTWYLDGVYVNRNDDRRSTQLGDNFIDWEAQLRELWVDLADAGLEMTFVLVHPTPGCCPLAEIHVLLLQQVSSDSAGVLLTVYDDSVGGGHPHSTALVVPVHFNRLNLIDVAGRSLDCTRNDGTYCSTWFEGFEITNDRLFAAASGQCFNLFIQHSALQEWDVPLPEDDVQDHVDLLQRSLTKVVRLTAAGDLPAPLPDYVEVPLLATDHHVQLELQCWGHDCVPVLLQCRDQAFCFPHAVASQDCQFHVLFENEDVQDLAGVFLHTLQQSPSSLELMIFLHALGYEKAVIVECRQLFVGLWKVLFCESTGTLAERLRPVRPQKPWPPPQPIVEHGPVFHCPLVSKPSCLLSLGVSASDLQTFFTAHALADSFEGIQVPDCAIDSIANLVPLEKYDRLVIYVDGTSQPSQKHKPPLWVDLHGVPDAWAFLVLGERYNDHGPADLCLVGWQAQQVRYEEDSPAFVGALHTGSLVAEREGMIFASLWRLCLNSNIPTVFRSDSELTCHQMTGVVGTQDVDISFSILRGLYQALSASMPSSHLLVEHVYGHNGDVWNELVDTIAKQEAQQSHFLPRQPIDFRTWTPVVPFLWLLFGEKFGGPKFCGEGFDIAAPDLPSSPACHPPASSESPGFVTGWIRMSLATANVATLGVGPQGFPGKLAFLQAQFGSFRLNFLGVQEARTAEGHILHDSILRLCSGACDSMLGVELWCNLAQPFLWQNDVPVYFAQQHFQVLHRDSRRLLVQVAHPCVTLRLFVGHAPQSGISLVDRRSWWERTDEILASFKDEHPVFVMIDANASPGLPDHVHVFEPGGSISPSTPFLRHFLEEHALCTVPGTLPDFDLATTGFDHTPVGLELQWQISMLPHQPAATVKPAYNRGGISSLDLSTCFDEHPVLPWHTDVDSHLENLNARFHSQLELQCPLKRSLKKKPFVTDEIWQLRTRKLHHRRQMKYARNLVVREALSRVFLAWKHSQSDLLDLSFNFGCTLYAAGLKHAAGFVVFSRQLKMHLQRAKKQVLADRFALLTDKVSALTVLHILRPFVGSSNALKKGPRPLPFVLDSADQPCSSPHAALERWITFFMHMEGGFRADPEQQKSRWIRNLVTLQVDHDEIPVQEIPSLTDLETAMRRIKPGKATGPDFLPAELFHSHAASIARQCYSLFLKAATQAHEPLLHKGGWLIPLWKGKGDKALCSSYRSILISAHMAKSFHRSLRSKHASVYAQFMQRQQIGGRKATPVGLGVHQVRAFQRSQGLSNRPTAYIFLDLAEAFYRVIRPLAISGVVTDELLAHVAQRLHLDASAIAELHDLLSQPSALEEAGVPDHVRRAVCGMHQDTHFALHGQTDRCVTTIGSRPGDAWADIVFGFLWAKVLHNLQREMHVLGLLEWIPDHSRPSLFGVCPESPGDVEFLGPCWCDDLCICVSGSSMSALTCRASTTASLLLDLCTKFGMLPNLQRGKTEIMFSVRGQGSRAFRTQFLGPSSSGTLQIVGEHGTSAIHLVGSYKHLGCVLHHAGDLKKEVRLRLAVAHQTFSKHRKLLFHNPLISLTKRAQIFQCLIGSRLLYGAESWAAPDAHWSDDEVLHRLQLPSPSELLRVARLRYLGTLFACGSATSWGILNRDTTWLRLVEDDLMWMHEQLHHSSDLLSPASHLEQWIHLIVWHRPYWKRLIRRASFHAVLQRSRQFRLLQFHKQVFQFLRRCALQPPVPEPVTCDPVVYFGCMACQQRCRSKGGEGAHMNRQHGQVCPVRQLFQGTQCVVCLREYHTHGKLKQHLLRSDLCRRKWLGSLRKSTPVPGIGSQVDRCQADLHDRCLPPLQAYGPTQQFQQERDFLEYDLATHDALALLILELPAEASLEVAVRELLCSRPISWTICCATLRALIEDFSEELDEFGARPLSEVVTVLTGLCDPLAWPFLQAAVSNEPPDFSDLPSIENACVDFCFSPSDFQQIPRQWCRHRVVLHAFAGRRRKGDFQYYLDQLQAAHPEGVCIHTASVDIIYDHALGDVSNPQTQAFWYDAIDRQYVIGFLGGPPCETWSKARAVQLADAAPGPRIVRTATQLWGLDCLRIRELLQILLGNDLLTFAVMCLFRLARVSGVGIVEHPADPDTDDSASIWRLPVLAVLRQLPGIEVFTFCQGLMGAPTPKPTTLLGLNVPTLTTDLRRHCITKDLPQKTSIGRLGDGSWATSRLKEYPPALCLALAHVFDFAIHPETSVEHGSQVEEFLTFCAPLFVQPFGKHYGQDYAG
eukprot:s1337_g14.t1